MLLTHTRFLTKQPLVKTGSNVSPASINNAAMRTMQAQRKSQTTVNQTGRFFSTATATATDATAPKMFCYQCEQTLDKKGCTTIGVCGKTPEVAALQDLLIYNLKGLSFYAHELREVGKKAAASGTPLTTAETEDVDANRFTLLAVFSTLTNVNFDAARMVSEIVQTKKLTERLKEKYHQACKKMNITPEKCPIPLEPYNAAAADPSSTISTEMWVAKGEKVGLLSRFKEVGDEAVVGVQEMLVYGLKGVCAYADHALMNSREHPEIYSFVHKAFAFLVGPDANNVGRLLDMLMECGRVNLLTMEKLYEANTTYGKQSPAKVPVKPVPGKCILVSGHELKFLEELLKQTEGKGINIYTHGEMLPAHAYPGLRKYKHLVGHFGLAWQRQNIDFGHFPGAILMTTNCLTAPKPKYKSKIFTAGAVGWANIPHVNETDFTPVIQKALELPGFGPNDTEFTYPDGEGGVKKVPSFEVGYGHDVVLSVAGTVLEAVKAGQIDRFYVIGGCDGSEGERSYYTELAQKLPPTSVVLTAGCGKYRINQLDFKTIGNTGIPRLLDLGQCNDSYSAVQIAVALAKALNCGVNDLPLSIVLSWFEQKAVAVLLSLLSLGIKGIRIGPRLPAFIKPSVLQVLSEKFDLKLVGEAEADLKQMLGKV